jgi:hypothetical protein
VCFACASTQTNCVFVQQPPRLVLTSIHRSGAVGRWEVCLPTVLCTILHLKVRESPTSSSTHFGEHPETHRVGMDSGTLILARLLEHEKGPSLVETE